MVIHSASFSAVDICEQFAIIGTDTETARTLTIEYRFIISPIIKTTPMRITIAYGTDVSRYNAERFAEKHSDIIDVTLSDDALVIDTTLDEACHDLAILAKYTAHN